MFELRDTVDVTNLCVKIVIYYCSLLKRLCLCKDQWNIFITLNMGSVIIKDDDSNQEQSITITLKWVLVNISKMDFAL